jgi:hypothetical protein
VALLLILLPPPPRCQHAGCYNHPIHERVIERIMSIVNLPQDYAEHMQLLKYHPGEYYRLHHDWIPEQLQARPYPPFPPASMSPATSCRRAI